jgi:lysophospholipase L1-like esterase
MLLMVSLAICAVAAWASPAVRILALGDSITFGCGDSCIDGGTYDCSQSPTVDCPDPLIPGSCHGGYRTRLNERLLAAGRRVTFVGPLLNGDLHHAGYSGAAVGPVSNQWSLAFLFPNFTLPAFENDIVLLHIGYVSLCLFTHRSLCLNWFAMYIQFQPYHLNQLSLLFFSTNDIWAGRTGAAIAADLQDLLQRLFTVWPRTHVMLSTMLYPHVEQDAHWKDYNSAMPGIVAALQSSGHSITLIDGATESGLCPAALGSPLCCKADDVHPSGAGYAVFANVWYNAIMRLYP